MTRALAFYPGLHQPGDARHFRRVCISIARLWRRRKRVGGRRTKVFVDSAAFTELSLFGRYRRSVADYARRLWELHTRAIVSIEVAAAQDYMCEPFILAKTGLTVADHQRLTIERYDDLLAELIALFGVTEADELPFEVLPVLQGWTTADYLRHLDMYGDRLRSGMWVGVGSVCKRQGSVAVIEGILAAIKGVRPDLRLHGFWREADGAEERQGSAAAVQRRQHGLVVRGAKAGPQRQRLARSASVRARGQAAEPATGAVRLVRQLGRVRAA